MGSLFPEKTVCEAFVKQICCGLRVKISFYAHCRGCAARPCACAAGQMALSFSLAYSSYLNSRPNAVHSCL